MQVLHHGRPRPQTLRHGALALVIRV